MDNIQRHDNNKIHSQVWGEPLWRPFSQLAPAPLLWPSLAPCPQLVSTPSSSGCLRSPSLDQGEGRVLFLGTPFFFF